MKNNRNTKIEKFALQIDAFSYQRLKDFPLSEDYRHLIFFENLHKLVDVKLHLHHSHIAEKISG